MVIPGLQKGVVSEYDPKTMTVTIVSSDGSSTYRNGSLTLDTMDYGNGSYDVKPPAPGSPCLFAVIDGEPFVVKYYLPINLGTDSENTTPDGLKIDYLEDQNPDIKSRSGSAYTRAPSDFPAKSTLSCDSVTRNGSGAEVGFCGDLYKLFVTPLLSLIMNPLNNVLDMIANVFHFKSPGLEVHSTTNQVNDCNISIVVRDNHDKLDGNASINLDIGKQAGLIRMSINGKSFLRVDNERNVILEGKRMIVDFDLVDFRSSRNVKLP